MIKQALYLLFQRVRNCVTVTEALTASSRIPDKAAQELQEVFVWFVLKNIRFSPC